MGRRTLLLIASILIAAVGTALIGLYVRGADDRAQQFQDGRSVLVAVSDLSAGITAQQVRAERQTRSAGTLPADYLTSLNAVAGQTLTYPVAGNTVLLKSMFSATGTTGGTVLKEGRRAVSFEFGDPQRTASLLGPGSKVTIYATNRAGKTKPVFDNRPITVLGVGSDLVTGLKPVTTATGRTVAVATSIVTLDLDDDEAGTLISASTTGVLYLGINGGAPDAAATPAAGN